MKTFHQISNYASVTLAVGVSGNTSLQVSNQILCQVDHQRWMHTRGRIGDHIRSVIDEND